MKKPTIILLGIALLFICIGGFEPAIQVFASRSVHTFTLADSPSFLDEELALAKARDALDADGLSSATWLPRRHRNATAPDQYMDRLGDHAGLFIFTNQTDSPRIVRIKLDGNRVVCRNSIAK